MEDFETEEDRVLDSEKKRLLVTVLNQKKISKYELDDLFATN